MSGAASGIGAATRARLVHDGHTVIGVDLRDTDVVADLGTAEGRAVAAARVAALAPDGIDGFVPCAGIAGLSGVDSRLVVSVNFFGAVDLLLALRPLFTSTAAVVLLSSNSVTCQPGWETAVATACVAHDERAAREAAGRVEAVQVYPATKAALAYWSRQEGVKPEWIGAGVRINAVAPGMIATPMTDQLRRDPQLGDFADAYPTAIGRPGRPEEVANLIAFLLSDAASLLVGSVVFADGGTDAMLQTASHIRTC